jgi:ubiquinol-cytochrome c reductase iron-sulfur subunit
VSDVVPGGASQDERRDASGRAVAVAMSSPVPERFENPGLPEHRPRLADIDRRAARRAELSVAVMFLLSMVGTVVSIVGYFAFRLDEPTSAELAWSNRTIGLGLFLTIFFIGIGAVQWAKTLMPDHEQIEERHSVKSPPETKAAAAEIIREGIDDSGIRRRPLILGSLAGALALAPLPALVLLKDLGPNPGNKLRETLWGPGVRAIVDPTKNPLRPEEIQIGQIVHILPEQLGIKPNEGRSEGIEYLNEKAKAAAIVIRLEENEVPDAARPGSYAGLVAYSKICTHMGCSVALYEQVTHHLLCPCHQSTFDVLDNCRVIFGPAARALPQLPIGVDDDGYLVATDGFDEPVGPSFWERGDT